ncbi:MAG: hypothetical protein ACXW3C_03555 [Pyrinomonadaceae bacterium]
MRPLMIGMVLLIALGNVHAQSDSDEMDKLKQSVKKVVSKEMEGWTYKSVQPTQGSEGVIIQHWQLNDIIVKVAITRYENQDDAETAFQRFKSHLKIEEQATSRNRGRQVRLIKEDSLQMGDEGFVWDIRGSEALAFRKGKYVVNVSVPSPAKNKDVFFSRKFAEHVMKAIKDEKVE